MDEDVGGEDGAGFFERYSSSTLMRPCCHGEWFVFKHGRTFL